MTIKLCTFENLEEILKNWEEVFKTWRKIANKHDNVVYSDKVFCYIAGVLFKATNYFKFRARTLYQVRTFSFRARLS